MKVMEIILSKTSNDRELLSPTDLKIDAIKTRMSSYVDKILDPKTSSAGKEFLKSKLRDDYHELHDVLKDKHIHRVAENSITESVNKIPLSDADFELVKELLTNPIPAIISHIYISEVIDDDSLTDDINSISENNPAQDVRPIIAEWLKRVMPDQLHRFSNHYKSTDRRGLLSPIHGYDPAVNRSDSKAVTGNAYGRV